MSEIELDEHGPEDTRAGGDPTGSSGWVLIAEGMSGTCVVLDVDPCCGAMAWALDSVGGDIAEDLGFDDTPGEPGVFIAWLGPDAMDDNGYIRVDLFEEVGPGWEWLGLTPARCSHLFVPDSAARYPYQKCVPNLLCMLCGWRLGRDADLAYLADLIRARAGARPLPDHRDTVFGLFTLPYPARMKLLDSLEIMPANAASLADAELIREAICLARKAGRLPEVAEAVAEVTRG